ncbi:FGGY-family carbohydrate kinase [Shimwellia pseudoproteus]|uniref:FGGY-family carbohydrate kinase n=1 Tax=Shimwellia pseudoproteus TaxID=570012 RepID=UPI0018ED58EF|nr:FGGY-family carbohydrate kinase [Shimwellia pseudoproteus]MBJ3814254.1 FGGY-family carbohydrate kinase [Shimwellia pseudoproteus]
MNNTAPEKNTLIGVDVGSGSVRAGIFDVTGQLLAHASHPITLYRSAGHHVEQSSDEIWQAVCRAIGDALDAADVSPQRVRGIGFDATCSLVVVGPGGEPLPVGEPEAPERNVIVWMDHRATGQAEQINATGHPVLQYVGGKISPEMETPKLLWLKEHRRAVYDRAWQFFDLADYLTWRATGDLARSTCTVTCKWTYLAHEKRWDPDYFHTIGLGDLAENNFARIGQQIKEPGTPCGQGLSAAAAADTGLPPGTPVAVGMIDAHAGGIGTVGVGDGALHNLAWVFGTSACTMTSTEQPVYIPGVWGPYFSAMVPGLWLSEGGQSAAGAAIDQLLAFHPAAAEARQQAGALGLPLPVYLADRVLAKITDPSHALDLVDGVHVVPEFLGNRAPFADPHARAVIAGLDMSRDQESLLGLYVAGLCGIGYGLRQIIDAQRQQGVRTDSIVISGGAGQHPLVRQLLADACDVPILTTQSSEPVLLGSAMLGAVAGQLAASVPEAMARMATPDQRFVPHPAWRQRHQQRYQSYQQLQHTATLIRGS